MTGPRIPKGLTPTPERTRLLAAEFVRILRDEWLEPRELAEVRRRNSYYGSACASHDFCDANMAMHEAMVNLALIAEDPESRLPTSATLDELSPLWNAAWDLAKAEYLTAPKGDEDEA